MCPLEERKIWKRNVLKARIYIAYSSEVATNKTHTLLDYQNAP